MTAATNRLQAAIDFICASESPWSRDNTPPWGIHDKDSPPYNRLYGPVHPRGGVAGVLVHDGAVKARWGYVHRSDLTWIDAHLRVVCVLRWIDPASTKESIARLMAAL